MNRIRLVSLIAALLITATQWAPFFSPVPTVAVPAVDATEDALPVIVITAHRES